MSNHNLKLGKLGEEKAKKYLSMRFYKILETNYRTRAGEIDIIAKDGDCVVFVEVKTRTNDHYGSPCEAVSYYKQKHMVNVAKSYIAKTGFELECRFDVIEVVINNNIFKTAKINHIKNVIN
jgi:putative endonuclease